MSDRDSKEDLMELAARWRWLAEGQYKAILEMRATLDQQQATIDKFLRSLGDARDSIRLLKEGNVIDKGLAAYRLALMLDCHRIFSGWLAAHPDVPGAARLAELLEPLNKMSATEERRRAELDALGGGQ